VLVATPVAALAEERQSLALRDPLLTLPATRTCGRFRLERENLDLGDALVSGRHRDPGTPVLE
jgi:hypothetical protein